MSSPRPKIAPAPPAPPGSARSMAVAPFLAQVAVPRTAGPTPRSETTVTEAVETMDEK